ncbi:sigma-70 family RNA polymerase sigma factor [Streptomyces xanthochromogenes]|uniref:sigma-70 family RNA polymerase sigma factor n=1 Tax=Streptomyces xanthochromogenes TaxID=67384 RepID=UPI0038168837
MPFETPGPPSERPVPGRPGRKLGPITDSVGSAHRAWLEPVRQSYLGSGLTLSELSIRIMFAKSKLSELLRGIGLYPRWEAVHGLSRELDLPSWPLYRLWRQAAFEAHKSSGWVERSSENSPLSTAPTHPPMEHLAYRELVGAHYTGYAQVFLNDDLTKCAVSDTFNILWLCWNDALASPDLRRFAWGVLRATVLAKTPHFDGRPEFGAAAFDTAVLQTLPEADHVDQIAETMELFSAMSRLPDHQLDVIVLRRLCGHAEEQTSALLGVSRATVRSDERHAVRFLESILCPPGTEEADQENSPQCPPPQTEGNTA